MSEPVSVSFTHAQHIFSDRMIRGSLPASGIAANASRGCHVYNPRKVEGKSPFRDEQVEVRNPSSVVEQPPPGRKLLCRGSGILTC